MTRPKDPTRISRRAAIAAIGGAGAAGAIGACKPGWEPPEDQRTSRAYAKPYVPGAEAYGTYEERSFRSSCGQCPASCGIRVRVVEGRAVRVEGDRDNPLNQGGIGPRGGSALLGLYDADRLTGPLKRVDGELVPISWDAALDELAGLLGALRAKETPERLMVWCGHERGVMHDLLERLCKVYGTPNFIDGRPGRTGVLAQAMEATLGDFEIPAYGWEGAGEILSLEAALVEDSCQSVYFTRVAAQLRRGANERAHLVHVGPMFDLAAYNADEWIRIRPGTGGAFALGLAQAILAAHPEETVLPDELVVNEAGFRAFAATFTPERVEKLTGIPPRVLAACAEGLWRRRPSFVVVDERSLSYSNGLDTALAALALNAVLGAFWTPTGGIRAAAPLPLAPWADVALDDVAITGLSRARLDGAEAFAGARCAHETLPEAIEKAGDQRPEIALLFHANPAYARQQPARWRRALAKIPHIVSFSPYLDETVQSVATLVLPDHTFLERWEVATPAPALDRAIATERVPVIKPLHDTRQTGEVILDLARRLGGNIASAMSWRSFRAASEQRLEGLRQTGRGNVVAAASGSFLKELHEVGFWIDDPPTAPPTPKVTLHAGYQEPTWYGDPEKYPLSLLVYRPLGYAEGSGANQPWLRLLRPRPGVNAWAFTATVHPESAVGLVDGKVVTVESEWGVIRATLHLDEEMVPGVVAVPLGAGHDAYGRWAKGFGANVLEIVRPGAAPDSGADVLCATRVRLDRAEEGDA